jgi:flagellin
MAQVISTNIASLNAQANLNKSQSTYTTAMSHLSSGKKVASAADNAAGLAISDRMQSTISGNNQAVNNANDGISLAQTAGSALSQITSNLQTIRTLAVQSANSTYSDSDRASLNQEAQQLLSQVNDIASQTQYNGQTLLNGSFGTATFQVGANSGQTVSVNLNQSVKTTAIGQTASRDMQISGNGLSGTTTTIAMGDGAAVTIGSAASNSAKDAVAAINDADISGLTATASNDQSFALAGSGNTITSAAGETMNLNINGTNIFGDAGYTSTTANSLTVGDLVNKINAASGSTNVSASLDSTGALKLSSTDGSNITVTQTSTGADKILAGASGTGTADAAVKTTTNTATTAVTSGTGAALQGKVSLSAAESITLGGVGAINLLSHPATAAVTATATGAAVAGWAGTAPTPSSGSSFSLNVTQNGVTKAISVDNTTPITTAAGFATAFAAALNDSTNGFGANAFAVTANATTGALTVTAGTAAAGAAGSFSISGTDAGAVGLTGVAGTGTTAVAATSDPATIGLNSATLSDIDLSTQDGASSALQSIDASLASISKLQGDVGAIQNRFDSTISNLQSATTNTQSAQSNITDADYSAESSTLSTADVLQQAGVAMVAKANQMPQQLLKLLQ